MPEFVSAPVETPIVEKPKKATFPRMHYKFFGASIFQANTGGCCGVKEVSFDTTQKKTIVVKIPSKEGKKVIPSWVKQTTLWSDSMKERSATFTPAETKPATFEEIKKAFKPYLKSLRCGTIQAYLLQCHEDGEAGKLLKESGFEYLGKFWNPNTRHTLHHYRLVKHREAPKPKKHKSVLST